MLTLQKLSLMSAAAALMAAAPAPAHANTNTSDEAFEFWLNPSLSTDLDDDTSIELETAQRFRSAEDGRVDTYFARFWVAQQVSDQATLAGAVERRINDGGSNELRTIQQLSTRHGIIRTRLRLEQRFVDDAGRMGLRLRPRVGVSVPVGDDTGWSAKADIEGFVTLASTRAGGDDGLTGMRTQLGLTYKFDDNFSASLTYLRQQDFEDNGPDEVSHAPLIGLEFSF